MASIRSLAVLSVIVAATATPSSLAIDVYEPDQDPSPSLPLASHGARQSRDLEGVGDRDYVHVDAVPRRSYEVSVSTARFFAAELARIATGDVVLQTGSPLTFNSARSATGVLQTWSFHSSSVMNWIESADAGARTRFVRVDSIGSTHGANSQYTLGLRETTLYCPRYNNTGGQVTVLIVQSAGPQESGENLGGCTWTADFYDGAYSPIVGHMLNGSFFGSSASDTSLAPNGVVVLPTPTVTAGTSGSIQIAHTCGYGKVQAKAVSVEPSTGFTFDTVCAPRPE